MIRIKIAIMFPLLIFLFSCEDMGGKKVDITFPVPKYCEDTIEQSIYNVGIENVGIKFKLISFDVNASYEPVDKYGVLTGKPTDKALMQRVLKAAIFKCSPDSSRTFSKTHPLVRQLSKEINKDLTNLDNSEIVFQVYNGQLVIYFDDTVTEGVKGREIVLPH
jgi:copper chaperone CopZ